MASEILRQDPRNPDNEDPENRLHALLLQMNAASVMITGEGFDSFSAWADDLQQNYLWMLSDLSSRALFAKLELDEERRAKQAQVPA